jgi:hypothetical protein
MALLRQSYPGQPVRFLDLGPAHARLSFEGTFGGPLEYAPRTTYARPSRALSKDRERCAGMMRAGVPCGRPAHGLSGHHRSAASCERDNAKRRARRAM